MEKGKDSSGNAVTTGILKIWDLQKRKVVHSVLAHKASVLDIAADFGRNRAISVAGGDTNNFVHWDLVTGQKIVEISAHTGAVNKIKADWKVGRALTASDDQKMKLWDTNSH